MWLLWEHPEELSHHLSVESYSRTQGQVKEIIVTLYSMFICFRKVSVHTWGCTGEWLLMDLVCQCLMSLQFQKTGLCSIFSEWIFLKSTKPLEICVQLLWLGPQRLNCRRLLWILYCPYNLSFLGFLSFSHPLNNLH